MSGHSCAELETAINEAALYAGYDRSDVITKDHFIKACLHTVFEVPSGALNGDVGPFDLSDPSEQMTQVVYHEAGHATVAEALDPGSVTLISAYSRKYGSGGFTSYFDNGDGDGRRRAAGHICRALGGAASLEIKFGIPDTGNGDDLNKAFRAVWELVTNNCLCGLNLHSNDFNMDDSPQLQERQEQATASEVERYYRITKEIITKNREFLDALAASLSEKGVLTADDIA